jgi:hypothetical protein
MPLPSLSTPSLEWTALREICCAEWRVVAIWLLHLAFERERGGVLIFITILLVSLLVYIILKYILHKLILHILIFNQVRR